MGEVGFGQPDDGIIQMAYVVPDLRAAIAHWTGTLRVGPWFVLEHFTGDDPVYRGQPSKAEVALAMSFCRAHEHRAHPAEERGALGVPRDDRAARLRLSSLGRGDLELRCRRGAVRERRVRAGLSVPPCRAAAGWDTWTPRSVLPGYTELIELGGAFEEVFGRFHRASLDWDGKDPIRSFI